jgi:dATP pyrophosphohydrolase
MSEALAESSVTQMKQDGLLRRAPMQVLILPFRVLQNTVEFAIFRRSDSGIWQGLSGGAEEGESDIQAAKREAMEEGRIPATAPFYRLQTASSVPVSCIQERSRRHWPADLLVIPNNAFAVNCSDVSLSLSEEHTEMRWVGYDDAHSHTHFESDKVALWELNERLKSPSLLEGILIGR